MPMELRRALSSRWFATLLICAIALMAAGSYRYLHFVRPNGLRVFHAFQDAARAGDFERAKRYVEGDLLHRDSAGRWMVFAEPALRDKSRELPVEVFTNGEVRYLRRARRCYLGLPGNEIVSLWGITDVHVQGGKIAGFVHK